MFKLMDLFKVV